MADRSRLAVVAAPLLGLLAALLLGWSMAAAQAPDPLTLTLTAERSECTAGTLNPVTWEISGGAPPYTLTIDGAPVDADAESATVTCGALPEGASEAPGTITAVVTDADGAMAAASAAYTIVEPLPAPETGGDINVFPDRLVFDWYTAETPAGGDALVAFLVRWREVGSPTWSYESQAPWADKDIGYGVLAELAGLRDPVAYEAAVAPMRHPLEAETPQALRWTPNRQATTVSYPANVTVTSTHDTVTIRWDRQPSATYWEVGLRNSRRLGFFVRAGRRISPADAEAWGDPASRTHEVTFRHLHPDAEYELRISSGTSFPTAPPRNADVVTVRTKAAPVGYTPLPRGPQNLRATSTSTSITATWDPPFVGAPEHYEVTLSDRSGRRLYSETVYAPPWTLTLGSPNADQSRLKPGTTYVLEVSHIGIAPYSAAIGIATKPQPDRLTLSFTASRSECTAGTLNPVRWEIRGGVGPHRLTVDGTSVDTEAEGATITCGPLPDGASAAPGTITATVTDAGDAAATARAVYTVVPPLPAPEGLRGRALDREIALYWDWRQGGDPVPMGTWTSACRCQRYLLRWRIAGTDVWTSSLVVVHFGPNWAKGEGHRIRGFDEGTTYDVAVAKIRDRIEQETPGALLWSAPVQITTFAPPTVEAIATHDTITVNWDPQPGVGLLGVSLSGRKTPHHWRREFTPDGGIPDHVVFRHLPPDTAYALQVWVDVGYKRLMTEITVNTAAAPAGWTPRPRGPQNLRTAVTHDSVKVDWEAPYPGADDEYTVELAHEDKESRTRTSVSGGVTRHTFTGLATATPYTVKVTHSDIVSGAVRLAVRTQARAGAPLRLALSVERAECTADTFTPVAWTIMGGTAPYSLTLAGEAVAAHEGRATVACGALSDDGGLLPATIEAQVTDATGAMASATAGYMIVSPFHGPLFSERAAGVEPLALTLTAVRAECTAGTLNPVVWTITGGTPPDTLTIDGEPVNADAERTMVTCGNLPEGASEVPATITAVVTDAAGATATARAAYTVVPPLPAPETAGDIGVHAEALSFHWHTAEPPAGADALVGFLVRWREVGSATWTYEAGYRWRGYRYGTYAYIEGLQDAVAYEAAAAPMRHPLEAETPQALRWTPSQQATSLTYAANVTVTTTHDTVTVRWDRQPSVTYWDVSVSNADVDAYTSTSIRANDAATWGDPASGTHEVTLRHLPPDTEYELSIATGHSHELAPNRYVDVTVRTKPAPAGYTPLPRGPQNVRATSTATSITVTWNPPFAAARQHYRVHIYAPPGWGGYPDVRRLYDSAIYSPPWTFTFISSAVNGGLKQWRLTPDTTFRISVVHWGIVRAEEEISIATQEWQGVEQAPGRLRLTLTVERSECTAGTLNSVSWEIRGGVEPYRDLTVDGVSVEANAESTTFTCGALPEGEEATRGTIWARVRDSAGWGESASAAYTIVPPRPPSPVCVEYLVGALACT